jgi:hypothetical protein
LSKILCQCSSLKVRDQVSHPCSTTGKITVLYILIFSFLIWEGKTKNVGPNNSKHSRNLMANINYEDSDQDTQYLLAGYRMVNYGAWCEFHSRYFRLQLPCTKIVTWGGSFAAYLSFRVCGQWGY